MSGNPNILPSDRAVIVGVIDPDAYATSTVATGWIDMAKYKSIMAVVMAGDLGASATLDAKLRQATDSSGTGAKDITGKAITQITDSNKQAVINLRDDELDQENGFTHVSLSMTIAEAASDAGAIVLGFDSPYQPAADLTSVDEIVS